MDLKISNRTYATVRHFARWLHAQVAPFPMGCPTDGVKTPEDEEPTWKGLSRIEQLRLLGTTAAYHPAGARLVWATAELRL